MATRRNIDKTQCIPCSITQEATARLEAYVQALKDAAHTIGKHGLSQAEFEQSGLFLSAIEKIRGTQAATTSRKKEFIDAALNWLQGKQRIKSFGFTGAGDRHDYQVVLNNDKVSIIEAKGCLDGNNTTIYTRPANADEFIIWSLCQNPGADPKHNLWSGVHTRLGGKIIAEKERVDALIVWDALCGTLGRPCPKQDQSVKIAGKSVPPPCVYLFPRSIPDPRNNPEPPVWKLSEVGLVEAILQEYGGGKADVTEVHIAARMNGANVERKTVLKRVGLVVVESGWTELKRAAR